MNGQHDTWRNSSSVSDEQGPRITLRLLRRAAIPALAAFIAVVPISLCAQGPGKRVVTPQDLWAMKRLSSPELSPDGRTAAVVVQEWSIDKNKSTSNIWLVPVAGGEPRRLTTAQAADVSPVWSPDGRRIAFVSKRGEDQATALYVIPTDGGEAEKILELPFPFPTRVGCPMGSA